MALDASEVGEVMPPKAQLPPGPGKRVPLNMRTTLEIRRKLEQAAANSGRSLTQEVEACVEGGLISPMTDQEIRARALECAVRFRGTIPAELFGGFPDQDIERAFWAHVSEFEAYIRRGKTGG